MIRRLSVSIAASIPLWERKLSVAGTKISVFFSVLCAIAIFFGTTPRQTRIDQMTVPDEGAGISMPEGKTLVSGCTVPTIEEGLSRWIGTNGEACISGEVVRSDSACKAIPLEGYACVSPGTCVDGAFARSARCSPIRKPWKKHDDDSMTLKTEKQLGHLSEDAEQIMRDDDDARESVSAQKRGMVTREDRGEDEESFAAATAATTITPDDVADTVACNENTNMVADQTTETATRVKKEAVTSSIKNREVAENVEDDALSDDVDVRADRSHDSSAALGTEEIFLGKERIVTGDESEEELLSVMKMVWSGHLSSTVIREAQGKAQVKRHSILEERRREQTLRRKLRAAKKEEEQNAKEPADPAKDERQEKRPTAFDTIRDFSKEEERIDSSKNRTIETTSRTHRWISDGWSARASFVRQLRLRSSCRRLTRLDFRTSGEISQDCVLAALTDTRCGVTPLRLATKAVTPGGTKIPVRALVALGEKGAPSSCFCCREDGGAFEFDAVVKNAHSWTLFRTCVDNHEHCAAWALDAKCESKVYAPFMRRHCSHSCGLCAPTTSDADEQREDVWSAWSACSASCGEGIRTRTCLDGPCEQRVESKACNVRACPVSVEVDEGSERDHTPRRSPRSGITSHLLWWAILVGGPVTALALLYGVDVTRNGWSLFEMLDRTFSETLARFLKAGSDPRSPKRSSHVQGAKEYRVRHSHGDFEKTPVRKDGNCLFVSLAAHWPEGDHVELRRRVTRKLADERDDINGMKLIQWLETNIDLPPGFELSGPGKEESDTMRYLDYISKDGSWGGLVEIYTAGEIMERDIVVLDFDGKDYVERYRTKVTQRGTVYVCYNGTNHYDCVRLLRAHAHVSKQDTHTSSKTTTTTTTTTTKSDRRTGKSDAAFHFTPLAKGDACVYEKDGVRFAASVDSRSYGDEFTLDTPFRRRQDVSLITSTTSGHVLQNPYTDHFARIRKAQDGVDIPDGCADYKTALREIERDGKKREHWMWYVWPTLRALRPNTLYPEYLLPSFSAAKLYLCDATLRTRLKRMCEVTLAATSRTRRSLVDILGPTDAEKFHESTTIFLVAAMMAAPRTRWRAPLIEVLKNAVYVASSCCAFNRTEENLYGEPAEALRSFSSSGETRLPMRMKGFGSFGLSIAHR
eukprot:g315.t1